MPNVVSYIKVADSAKKKKNENIFHLTTNENKIDLFQFTTFSQS
jgi:hypothetical protein